jgi:hypothetical protein
MISSKLVRLLSLAIVALIVAVGVRGLVAGIGLGGDLLDLGTGAPSLRPRASGHAASSTTSWTGTRSRSPPSAAAFLGHTSTAITEGHYIERDRAVDPTPAAHLERTLRPERPPSAMPVSWSDCGMHGV